MVADYFPAENLYAIYTPLGAPILLTWIAAAVRQCRKSAPPKPSS